MTAEAPGDFWSRRKAAVAAEEQAARAAEADAREQAEHEDREARQEAMSDAELLEELELPDPDTLGAGDDFSAFLRADVPARLRTRALRRLWRTNPVLANVDGMVDYGGDFTDAAMVPEVLNTVYRVGKGMVRDLIEDTDAPVAKDDPVEEPAEPETAELSDAVEDLDTSTDPALPSDPSFESKPDDDPEASTPIAFADDHDDMPPPKPRRMRFSYDVPEDTA
ncbi:MAG: DUF3306 domain-containing protein [Pseudomonadota bacterium]